MLVSYLLWLRYIPMTISVVVLKTPLQFVQRLDKSSNGWEFEHFFRINVCPDHVWHTAAVQLQRKSHRQRKKACKARRNWSYVRKGLVPYGNLVQNRPFSLFVLYGTSSPVSRKPRKLFGPAKPLLVGLYLKTGRCIVPKRLVWREPLFLLRIHEHKSSIIIRFEILLWLSGSEIQGLRKTATGRLVKHSVNFRFGQKCETLLVRPTATGKHLEKGTFKFRAP